MNVSTWIFWSPVTVIFWFDPTFALGLSVTSFFWLEPTLRFWSFPMLSVTLFFTSMVMFFEVLKNICSLPLVSPVRISLELPPPGVVAVWIELFAASFGRLYGGGMTPL